MDPQFAVVMDGIMREGDVYFKRALLVLQTARLTEAARVFTENKQKCPSSASLRTLRYLMMHKSL